MKCRPPFRVRVRARVRVRVRDRVGEPDEVPPSL